MSWKENRQFFYFSTILAKALQECDGDRFTELYDLICPRTSNEEVNQID